MTPPDPSRKDTMSTDSTDSTAAPRGIRVFNALVGVTTLGILLQAITAGEFVSQRGRGAWIAVHDIIANATIVAAIVVAVIGIVLVRATDRALAWSSVALAVLLVVQTVIGHLITDAHADAWIGVHVPLAFVIVALAVWLAIRGAGARRRGARA
jgi:hypothetical protein